MGHPDGTHDWSLGFGHYEEDLMSSKFQAKKCLKLLKYFVLVNEPCFSVWSYFLKTIVMDMIMNPPNKKFWKSPLFFIFLQALGNFCYFLHTDHCNELRDIFFNTFDLLRHKHRIVDPG